MQASTCGVAPAGATDAGTMPVERLHLHHFLPGSRVLCAGRGTAPAAVAKAARRHSCQSVALSDGDPAGYLEDALAIAEACHEIRLQVIAVSAGDLSPPATRRLFTRMDAASIVLHDFHGRGALPAAPLDTLISIRHDSDCWLELAYALRPDDNDGEAELLALARWIVRELGPDVPLHFTAAARLPAADVSLHRARDLAFEAGLHFVYAGGGSGAATACPSCGQVLIARDDEGVCHCALLPPAGCPGCGQLIAGRFGKLVPHFAHRHLPAYVRLKA